jgi:hypothetical protein
LHVKLASRCSCLDFRIDEGSSSCLVAQHLLRARHARLLPSLRNSSFLTRRAINASPPPRGPRELAVRGSSELTASGMPVPSLAGPPYLGRRTWLQLLCVTLARTRCSSAAFSASCDAIRIGLPPPRAERFRSTLADALAQFSPDLRLHLAVPHSPPLSPREPKSARTGAISISSAQSAVSLDSRATHAFAPRRQFTFACAHVSTPAACSASALPARARSRHCCTLAGSLCSRSSQGALHRRCSAPPKPAPPLCSARLTR